MSQSIELLQSQIQSMSSDRVKSIVLFWLETKEKTIVEFEQLESRSESPQHYEFAKHQFNSAILRHGDRLFVLPVLGR